MKHIFLVSAFILLVALIGCSSSTPINSDIITPNESYAEQLVGGQTIFPIYEEETMVVTYWKDTRYFFMEIRGDHDFWESGNVLYVDGQPTINDLTKIGYAVYPDQPINIPMQWDEALEMDVPIPTTIEDLNLIPMSAEYLPRSEHIAKLVAVNATQAKPATVRRRYWGENYDVKCLVTESVKQMWLDGNLQVNDYVLVSFIEEIPETEERHIAIVTGKIFKSW